MRPASPQDRCFYCDQRMGEEHLPTCVLVKRRVLVRYTYELEIEVPISFSQHLIEFQRNDGTWCADNGVEDLQHHVERLEKAGYCTCPSFKCEYLGEVEELS